MKVTGEPLLVAALAGITLPALAYFVHRKLTHGSLADRSTTSSAGGGPAAYETSKAVSEYLQMHYATADEIFPYDDAPKSAVNFTERCALLVEKHCAALKNFTDERRPPTALDIGCAVGGATFELSKCGFESVLGLDYSQAFVDAATSMKEDGSMAYEAVVEAEIVETRRAFLPADCEVSKVRFRVGDACNLPDNLAEVDAVLASNLICRLPDPLQFLNQLSRIVVRGGVVVLTTPFSWLEAWTPKKCWLGGYVEDGRAVDSFDRLTAIMNRNGFELRATEDMPFVIREHARKFQYGCAQGSVWIKT